MGLQLPLRTLGHIVAELGRTIMSMWFRRKGKSGVIHVLSATDPWTICMILIIMAAIIVGVVLY